MLENGVLCQLVAIALCPKSLAICHFAIIASACVAGGDNQYAFAHLLSRRAALKSNDDGADARALMAWPIISLSLSAIVVG